MLTPWRDEVAGLLEAWYPGLERRHGDRAGAVRRRRTRRPAAGHLPEARGRRAHRRRPRGLSGGGRARRYKEGVFVGYRWFDEKGIEPAFPFGFGLSYTRFRFSDLRVRGRSVEVTVTNTGRRRGVAVPQLYVEIPARPSLAQPPRQLKGFAKVRLAPGRSARVRFPLAARTFSWWDPRRDHWTVAPGCHRVLVGSSSRDLPLRACADPPASS